MKQNNLIDKIVEQEWMQFTAVQNQGGRATCQDDRVTFDIMRRSQFLTWDIELLESYSCDLEEAEAAGWNLMAEKYARMMESTSPGEYEKVKDRLPYRNDVRKKKQEVLVLRQVEWLEKTYRKYPHLAKSGRPIHTWEDTLWQTSFETYLRGELGIYSDQTLELYALYIKRLEQKEENLAEMTLDHTAKLYGYRGLEDINIEIRNGFLNL